MNDILKITAASVLSLSLASCASTPEPSPRIQVAEAELARAKSSPETVGMGRLSLEKAEESLSAAKRYYNDGDDEDFIHSIRMAENYIELAETRGDIQRTENEIKQLKDQQSQIQLAVREREAERQAAGRSVAEMEAAQANLEARSAEAKNQALRARNQRLQGQLSDYKMKETALGMMMVFQNMQFATDSSVFREGAKERLQPLADYLKAEEGARIRIEGHTDSRGDEAYNKSLSHRRASSVAEFLTRQGISESRIDIVGMGEEKPIASNDTVSGREENRRVEVTILND